MAGRNFYIVSELNGKVLDIKGGKKEAGTNVIVFDKHPKQTPNQLWQTGAGGFVVSAMNGMTFGAKLEGHVVQMQAPGNEPGSQWRFHGKQVVNGSGMVLDIKGASHSNGAEVIAFHNNGQNNQLWRQEFV